MNYTIRVAKTKALTSFAVTAKLICVFVFAYADFWFSHEAAQIVSKCLSIIIQLCKHVVAKVTLVPCSVNLTSRRDNVGHGEVTIL